ncbi:hypothetical protein ACQJBY_029929 [Aegilops geniculata]
MPCRDVPPESAIGGGRTQRGGVIRRRGRRRSRWSRRLGPAGTETKRCLLPWMPSSFVQRKRLPDKFAKMLYGHEPRKMKLREAGRRRLLWDVDVEFDADGHMYLGHRWKQFAQAHDLRLGHFLVLSYDGHDVLTVKVFDGSMCRRDYQHDDDASNSSSDSGNTLYGTSGDSGNTLGVSKMSNPCDSDGSQKERSSSEELSEDSLSADNSVESANLRTLSNNYVVSMQCYLTKEQKVKIDALMEKIKPKFTVLVVQMKKSNIEWHTLEIIQKDYALKHFPREDTTVMLQLPGKNKGWKCTFRIRPSGASDAGRRILYLHNFACDNHVREGDICLFQPMTNVEQRKFVVRVHFLNKACIDGTTQSQAGEGSDSDRCPKEGSSYTSKDFSEENPSAYESVRLHVPRMPSKDYVLAGKCDLTLAQEKKIQALVRKMRPQIPVLVAQMKKSNVDRGCGTLAIPKDYALQYFPCESTSIILQLPSKDKAWKCRLYIRPSGVCNPGRRSLYWRSFAVDNHVREGDICLFQPMTNDKHRTFIVIVHLLHKASVESSPVGRSDVGSNRGRTSAKMVLTANVNEEPATDGEEISPSGHENDGDSDDSEGASEPLFVAPDRPRLTDAQKKKVLEKVHAIGSESLPICVIVMNNTSVRLSKSSNSNSGGPYLTFCKQYVSRYLEKQNFTRHRAKKNVISLVLQWEGRSRRWHTELRLGNNRPMIVKGWTSFARDNRLQVDDLCLFKLMRNEETLKMMVYIIRRKKCLA